MPYDKIISYKKGYINLNTGFYKDLDTNFEQAYLMSEKNFSHSELLDMLQNGNIPQRQIAALKLDRVENPDEARILMNNLTGCDGKIREAVAFKINSFLIEDEKYVEIFANSEFAPVFADAVIDINANICRLIADSVCMLKTNRKFAKFYTDKIIRFAHEAFAELDKFIFRDKKYVINKQLFKLYWTLETLKDFCDMADSLTIQSILKQACAQKEYTVREKAAQIAVKYEYTEIIDTLKEDNNYYVRAIFLNH